jgi:hypothetical protein
VNGNEWILVTKNKDTQRAAVRSIDWLGFIDDASRLRVELMVIFRRVDSKNDLALVI